MEYGLTDPEPRRKPSNSPESTHKCALALMLTPVPVDEPGAVVVPGPDRVGQRRARLDDGAGAPRGGRPGGSR